MSFNPGSGSLAGSSDVVLSNPAVNEVLLFDDVVQKWKNSQVVATPSLDAAYSPRLSGLGILYAGLAARTTQPCRIVFAGSSTTEGVGVSYVSGRYVNRLVSAIQAAYPSGIGVERPVIASTSASFGALSAAVGVHGYNAGEGGTTAANYLTAGEISAICALNPRAVFHMIGSNDYQAQVAIATYVSNLEAAIASLDAGIGGPVVHILVHSFQRTDVASPTLTWAQYGQALKGVAEAASNRVFIDLSGDFALARSTTTDPLDLIAADNIHPTESGHALLATLLRTRLGIPGSTSAQLHFDRLTTDAFSGSGELVGRSSDVGLGGATKVWVGSTGAVTVGSGVLTTTGTAAFFVGVPEGSPGIETSVRIVSAPASSEVLIDVHRQSELITGSPDTFRLGILSGLTLELRKRIGGVITVLMSGIPYAIGDRVGLRWYGGMLYAIRNGAVVGFVADSSVAAAGYSGFAGLSSNGWSLDDFVVESVI